jgi:hypothetical protein
MFVCVCVFVPNHTHKSSVITHKHARNAQTNTHAHNTHTHTHTTTCSYYTTTTAMYARPSLLARMRVHDMLRWVKLNSTVLSSLLWNRMWLSLVALWPSVHRISILLWCRWTGGVMMRTDYVCCCHSFEISLRALLTSGSDLKAAVRLEILPILHGLSKWNRMNHTICNHVKQASKTSWFTEIFLEYILVNESIAVSWQVYITAPSYAASAWAKKLSVIKTFVSMFL